MYSTGEVIAHRELDRDPETGVFLTGQQAARMQGERNANLSYADNSGNLIIMPCLLAENGDWSPMGMIVRCSVTNTVDAHLVPEGFELSVRMRAALDKAQKRRKS